VTRHYDGLRSMPARLLTSDERMVIIPYYLEGDNCIT